MKMKKIVILSLLSSTLVLGASGSLLIDAIEPAGSNAPISSALYNATLSGLLEKANGQSFITSTAFDLARIILVKGTSQSYNAGSMLRLHFFAWNPASDANDVSSWGSGDGTGDGDPLNGTGMTLLFSQDFELAAGSHAAESYIHFNLGTNIALAANTAYGFTSEFISTMIQASFSSIYSHSSSKCSFLALSCPLTESSYPQTAPYLCAGGD